MRNYSVGVVIVSMNYGRNMVFEMRNDVSGCSCSLLIS